MRVVEVPVPPRSPEEDELLIVFGQPARSGVVVDGVGQYEGVHVFACAQGLVVFKLILLGIRLIKQDAHAEQASLRRQGMEQFVEDGGLAVRGDADGQGVAAFRAQPSGGGVGRITEFPHGLSHFLFGFIFDQVGPVEEIGDGLGRDAGFPRYIFETDHGNSLRVVRLFQYSKFPPDVL